jgi:hypothetical protein
MIVECADSGCLVTFEEFGTGGRRKQYCSPDCSKQRYKGRGETHPTRKAKRDAHNLTFYAVDGEGENRAIRYAEEWDWQPIRINYDRVEHLTDEQCDDQFIDRYQDYVMLSVGDHTLTRDGKILKYQDIFPFLYARFLEIPEDERKYSVFVGFRLQYDFTMFTRHLPETQAMRLFSKEGIDARRPLPDSGRYGSQPVYITTPATKGAQWEVDFLGMKRMKIRPHVAKKNWPDCTVNHATPDTIATHAAGECRRNHPYQWQFICDAHSYFQGAFLNVINPEGWAGNAVVTDDEYRILVEGKSNRNAAKFGPEMERYNLMENEVLARVLTRLNEGFVSMGIRIPKDKWYGPGAAAQLWLKNHGMPSAKVIGEHVPSWALDAGQWSYYGGRFENAMHGIVPGQMFNYDINSAYPYAIATMPCLLHGQWTKGEGSPPKLEEGSLRLAKVRAIGRSKFLGGLPFRDRNGSVSFPQQLTGWYWEHEIVAAKQAKLITYVTYLEWVDYRPCGCPPPMATVSEAYQERLSVGKNTPHGKALKLVINSLYGKYAQSIGLPTYACSLYASFITSRCRTQILEAIATHPVGAKAVAKIATDGVYFTSQHPTLPITKELGDWDETIYENMSFFLPGVDWDDKTRQKLAEHEGLTANDIRSRGVSAQKLADNIANIDPQWETLCEHLKGLGIVPLYELYELIPTYKVNLGWGYITPKLAAARGKWDMCGVSEFNQERVLSGSPVTKRVTMYRDKGGFIRSEPYRGMGYLGTEEETTYYDKLFGRMADNVDTMLNELSQFATKDGTIFDRAMDILGVE